MRGLTHFFFILLVVGCRPSILTFVDDDLNPDLSEATKFSVSETKLPEGFQYCQKCIERSEVENAIKTHLHSLGLEFGSEPSLFVNYKIVFNHQAISSYRQLVEIWESYEVDNCSNKYVTVLIKFINTDGNVIWQGAAQSKLSDSRNEVNKRTIITFQKLLKNAFPIN